MGAEVIFIIYILAVCGFVCLIGLVELVFNLLLKHVPWIRNKWENYCKNLPEWDE